MSEQSGFGLASGFLGRRSQYKEKGISFSLRHGVRGSRFRSFLRQNEDLRRLLLLLLLKSHTDVKLSLSPPSMASIVASPPPSEPPDPDLDVVFPVDPPDPPVPPDPPPRLPLSNPPSFHLLAHSELLPHIDLACSLFITARAASVIRDYHGSISSSSSPRSASLVSCCQGLQRTRLLLLLQSITTHSAIDDLKIGLSDEICQSGKAPETLHIHLVESAVWSGFLCGVHCGSVDGLLSTTRSCSVQSKPPFDVAPGTCAFMLSLIELDDKLTWLVSGKLQIHHGNVGFQSICLSSTIAYSSTLVKVTRRVVSSYNDNRSSANNTPLQFCYRKDKSEQYLVEALLQKLPQPGSTSENSDVRCFTPSFSDDWQQGFSSVKTLWRHHGNAGAKSLCRNSAFVNALEVLVKLHYIVIVVNVATLSLLDSPSPCFQASTVSLSFSANIMLAEDSVSLSGFKAVHICFSAKSSQIGLYILIPEAITFRSALYKALTLEFSTLKVLSDRLTLMRAITGNLQSKEIIGTVKDIRSISSGFATISFYHVYVFRKKLFKLISLCNGHHDLGHRFGLISSS
ncbi:Uncharacterized protein Rs2_13250 [Raphanus sativus]|nr:Uncharacterized protein Rs2_13250 [Raphanus sativus]